MLNYTQRMIMVWKTPKIRHFIPRTMKLYKCLKYTYIFHIYLFEWFCHFFWNKTKSDYMEQIQVLTFDRASVANFRNNKYTVLIFFSLFIIDLNICSNLSFRYYHQNVKYNSNRSRSSNGSCSKSNKYINNKHHSYRQALMQMPNTSTYVHYLHEQ